MREKEYDKSVFFQFKEYDIDGITRYLNKMADAGFFLLEIANNQMFFRQGKPDHRCYSIGVVLKSDESWQYREYCESAGWHYVCETKYLQIYDTTCDLPMIDTEEEQKYEVVGKMRRRMNLWILVKLAAVAVGIGLVWHFFGLVLAMMYLPGLCLAGITVAYIVLLLAELIDYLHWKHCAKRSIVTGDTVRIQPLAAKKTMDTALKGIMLFLYLMSFVDALIRTIASWNTAEFMHFYIVVVLITLLLMTPIVMYFRLGVFARRGGSVQFLINIFWTISMMIICRSVTESYGTGNASIQPQWFVSDAQMADYENSLEEDYQRSRLYIGQTVVGRVETNHVLGFYSEKNRWINSYKYQMVESSLPFFMQEAKRELLAREGLCNYMKLYRETDDERIYLASNQLSYEDDEEVMTYDTDLEYYEGCIVMEQSDQLLVFYYANMEGLSVDDLIVKLDTGAGM